MLHNLFRRNRPTGSWKEVLIPFMGIGSDLGNVTDIMLMNFHFLVPKGLHIILVENDPSEKSKMLIT